MFLSSFDLEMYVLMLLQWELCYLKKIPLDFAYHRQLTWLLTLVVNQVEDY